MDLLKKKLQIVNSIKITLISLIILLSANQAFANEKSTANFKLEFSDDEFDDFDEFEDFSTTNHTVIKDPYEKINRKIYVFNDYFDRYFFEHVARFYRKGVPKRARKIISNFTRNLSLPVSAFNSFAQGKVNNGLATISNFIINSTIGVLGIFEIASEKGILYNREDFGQTLGHYNISSGSYLMLPFLGPSSTRDFSGFIVDNSISPTGFNLLEFGKNQNLVEAKYLIGITLASAVNQRESILETLDDVRKDSFDPYATIRSAYLQRRLNEVNK